MLNLKTYIMKKVNRRKKSLSEDIAKVAIIFQSRKWAKMIVDSIPDLEYDDYLRNYKAIWNIVLPASSLLLMRKYATSDLEKTFLACMSAGIARAINERARRD